MLKFNQNSFCNFHYYLNELVDESITILFVQAEIVYYLAYSDQLVASDVLALEGFANSNYQISVNLLYVLIESTLLDGFVDNLNQELHVAVRVIEYIIG